ncbi:hypothetical protein, partial [Flavonifractor plautii]|uniref:hypothetical protein n=1 Tax=Flavonifractor plautii TaxID=292800 RepID=UPI0019D65E36
MLANKLTIRHEARLIPFVVAFFKVFYQLARVVGTLKTIGQSELHPKSWTRKSTKGVQKSMGKELFSEELKLAVVQYVLEGHTRKEASEKFCVS